MDNESKEKRRKAIRFNKMAKDLRSPKYRLRRVENKKKLYERVSKKDILEGDYDEKLY